MPSDAILPQRASSSGSLGRRADVFPARLTVFVGALNPEERLDVDHIPWPHVANCTAHSGGEVQVSFVRRPVGAGNIIEWQTDHACRFLGSVGLEKNVLLWLSNEAEHC